MKAHPKPGDPCEECGSPIQVVDSDIREAEGRRVRYLGCRTCGTRPAHNKIVVPLESAPPRINFRTLRIRQRGTTSED